MVAINSITGSSSPYRSDAYLRINDSISRLYLNLQERSNNSLTQAKNRLSLPSLPEDDINNDFENDLEQFEIDLEKLNEDSEKLEESLDDSDDQGLGKSINVISIMIKDIENLQSDIEKIKNDISKINILNPTEDKTNNVKNLIASSKIVKQIPNINRHLAKLKNLIETISKIFETILKNPIYKKKDGKSKIDLQEFKILIKSYIKNIRSLNL